MSKNYLSKDLITFSIFMGGICTLIQSIITLVPFYLHITNNMGILIMGKTIFNLNKLPLDPSHLIIAFVGHLCFGAIMAIGLSVIFLKTGTDFCLIKGGFYGIVVWIIIRSVLITLGIPGDPKPLNFITASISLFSHVVYGLTLAYLIKRYNKFILR
jgi:hypothetical protein